MVEDIATQQTMRKADEEAVEFCGGQSKATEVVIDPDRATARAEAKRLARETAEANCAEKRCPNSITCKLTNTDVEVDVRPTPDANPPTFTATATVTGRCSC